jgi:FkbM family methyltransferase
MIRQKSGRQNSFESGSGKNWSSHTVNTIRELLRPWRHRQLASKNFRRIVRWMATQPDIGGPIVYDIGARWGISPPYDRLTSIPGFRSVGFEPDLAEAEKLQAANAFDHVCPVALGARAEKKILHIGKDPGSSSLFPPNAAEIARHTEWRLFETVRKLEVTVEPLDAVIHEKKLPSPDYLKMDCEGAENEILDGAVNTLGSISGLTFEARFRDFYHGGATLSQLTDRMFDAGFICLRLDPGGAFFGALILFDVVMIRHPDTIRDRRQFILCVLFCLLHGNWLYARRTVELRADDFGCSELRHLLG